MFHRKLTLFLLSAAAASAMDLTTSSQANVPGWLSDQAMQMRLTLSSSKSDPKTLEEHVNVLPLTTLTGLDQSSDAQARVSIRGSLTAANQSNYNAINHPNDIAYLSCDDSSKGYIDHNQMLNDLMSQRPGAILLYTTSGNWCSLSSPHPDGFANIVTMTSADQSSKLLAAVTNGSFSVSATIQKSHNDTSSNPNQSPAVATSLLYGITGFITLLFVCIIVTGALRAHRNPQRYGPRAGANGRSRQSRARGLARAMLETIPIVKFGDRAADPKTDPAVELENGTNSGEGAQPTPTLARETRQSDSPSVEDPDRVDANTAGSENVATTALNETEEKYTECSICTENFTVGEDVRVLPCNHQFHPACIDPWLTQVSGTCPLCRLDLRVGHEAENENAETAENSGNPATLPPPIHLESDEISASNTDIRHDRLAQLIVAEGMDIYGVRRTSPAEQLAALRRLSTASQARAQAAANRERQHGVSRFTDRLRDRFRIRTRAQPFTASSDLTEAASQSSEPSTQTPQEPSRARLSLIRGSRARRNL